MIRDCVIKVHLEINPPCCIIWLNYLNLHVESFKGSFIRQVKMLKILFQESQFAIET